MLAHRFGEVGNDDIQHYRPEHPHDIGMRLRQFATAGWLEKGGHGRGTRYRWPSQTGRNLLSPMREDSEHLPEWSEHLPEGSEHLPGNSEHPGFEHLHDLLQMASGVRNKGKVSHPVMEAAIMDICRDDWRTLRELASLLNREADSLRNHYINPMLKEGRLEQRVPGKPNHPNQAYRTRATL